MMLKDKIERFIADKKQGALSPAYRIVSLMLVTMMIVIVLGSFTTSPNMTLAAGDVDSRLNEFKVADLSGEVNKATYTVINTSNTGAVVRVLILPIAIDDTSGELLAQPAYTMGTGWTDGGDGWWYYNSVLNANSKLGDRVGLFGTAPVAPAGATLTIEIKAEFSGIGRTGTSPSYHYAYQDAWFSDFTEPAALKTALASAINGWFTAKEAELNS